MKEEDEFKPVITFEELNKMILKDLEGEDYPIC